jgi:hypothetical protein
MKSLDETKEYLATKYSGRVGIHSVGISRSENAIRVYFAPGSEHEQEQILATIEAEASPYRIIAIRSESPSILDG